MKQRMLCWFSCGAASAVAAKETLNRFTTQYDVIVVNCDTRPSEHPDNYRFSADCEKWFGQPIVYLRSSKYETVDDVFEKTRYMSGVAGARCTTELKKIPRLKFQRADDVHVWGFTAGETDRINQFKLNNPDMLCRFILQEFGISKKRCIEILGEAGIELPVMYRLFSKEDYWKHGVTGFDNNNCPGCVKAKSKWYWDMIRKYFPEVFKRRCEQSRTIGARLIEIDGVRVFLDELPPGPFKRIAREENIPCGPECGTQSEFSELLNDEAQRPEAEQ